VLTGRPRGQLRISRPVDRVDLSISDVVEHAELRAPRYGEDAVVWEEIDQRTAEETRLTWAFVMFLALATQLAAIAAIIDSPILIVRAMVLGPEFGAVAVYKVSVPGRAHRCCSTSQDVVNGLAGAPVLGDFVVGVHAAV
jgi:hypothetical protein